MLEKFRADVNAELTVELEEQEETERSFMALPVDFTKEDVARVIGSRAIGYIFLRVKLHWKIFSESDFKIETMFHFVFAAVEARCQRRN